MGKDCHGHGEESRREEIVTCPTETEVRTRTKEVIVKHIHPKEIINVHRTVIKNEHCFPVHERDVHETVVEGESGCHRKHECGESRECHHRNRCCRCRRNLWFW
ncbi:CotD family spore coat protein [Bacillus massiliigorillae]|uniref:CotD family spore coat protein n=1 Tax=Bacillus massiliigorillae TaxID=1243664 RepID=UPI00069433D3|nr:CotD family spore coat protein [Bacillus massiliigorillae]